LAAACGVDGITVAELRDVTGWHHGKASAALSVLHKEGRLVRLQERRERCSVYVRPDYVAARAVSPYRRNRTPTDPVARELMKRYLELRDSFTQGAHQWRELDRQVRDWLAAHDQ
jgi:hypothetical protein